MMKKTLSVLILVFLVGLVIVNAEKVDIGDYIIDYILDHYKDAGLTETSVILYCNPSIVNCEEFEKATAGLSRGSVFITNDYFTELSTGSLAVCLLDFSTRSGIKPREVKDYIDYCKNFEVPPGGLDTIYQEREQNRFSKYVKLPESSLNEDLVYVIIDKIYQESGCIVAQLNWASPRVQAKYKADPDFSDFSGRLQNKVENFVSHRINDKIFQRQIELTQEVNRLLEEKNYEEYQRVYDQLQELMALWTKAGNECNFDILGDYAEPFEGEVIDGYTIVKGRPPEPEYNYPPKLAEYHKEIDKGNILGTTMVISRLGDVYVFVEDEAKQKSIPTIIPAEEKPIGIEEKPPIEEKPVVEEKPKVEEKPVVEEQPVTGINRIINPIKKFFTGEPEKTEEIPSEQPAEQPKEEKKENFVTRFFKKIFSWF